MAQLISPDDVPRDILNALAPDTDLDELCFYVADGEYYYLANHDDTVAFKFTDKWVEMDWDAFLTEIRTSSR